MSTFTSAIGRVRLRGRMEPLEVHALVGDETVRGTASYLQQLEMRSYAHLREGGTTAK